MKELLTFLENNFGLIWLGLALTIVLSFYFLGKAALVKLGPIDPEKIVFKDKFGSGYSTKSWRTRRGGASKVLHIIVTDEELILTTWTFLAYIAQKNDLLQRIPLHQIVEIRAENGTFAHKLSVRFVTSNGEQRDMVLISANNVQLKSLLENS